MRTEISAAVLNESKPLVTAIIFKLTFSRVPRQRMFIIGIFQNRNLSRSARGPSGGGRALRLEQAKGPSAAARTG